MHVVNITEGSLEFTSNAYLVTPEGDADADDAAPGDAADGRRVMVDAGQGDGIVDEIRDHVEGLDALVLTHTHPDHVGAVSDIVEAFGVDVWGYGTDNRYADHELGDGDVVEMAGTEFEVIFTPGHAVDHVCCYGDGVLFSGDLVFGGGSFGRTDIAGSDRDTLIESIERLLDRIGDRPVDALYAGHQPPVQGDAKQHVEAALRNAQQMR